MARRSDNVTRGIEKAPMRSLFYAMGYTKEELDAKDTGFTYNAIQPKTNRDDFTPTIQRADTDTQEFLEKHF